MLQNNMRVSRSFSLALDAWRPARRPEPRDFPATNGLRPGQGLPPGSEACGSGNDQMLFRLRDPGRQDKMKGRSMLRPGGYPKTSMIGFDD
jgi:hypothetical protein